MKFFRVFLCFVTIFFFHIVCYQKAHCNGGPDSPMCFQSSIVFASTNLDIGLIVPGTQYSNSISFQNKAPLPVVIRSIRTSTPHLEAHVTKSELHPGMAGELIIKFRPQMWPPGPFTSSVVLYSNDAVNPVAKVEVTGFIRYPIIWEPINLEFTVQKGKPDPVPRVRIYPRDSQALGPIGLTVEVPHLTATAEPDQLSNSFFVTTRVDPSVPCGEYTGSIEIHTNNPMFPLLNIPVRYQVLGDLRTLPDIIDFGFVQEAKLAEARITIDNHGDRKIQLQKIEPELPVDTKVNFKELDAGRYEVTVQISSPPPLQDLKGHLSVFTDHPDQPVIQVPVKGWVWAAKPFALVGAGKNNDALFALTKAALERDDLMSPTNIVSKILGDRRDDQAVSLLENALLDDDWVIRARACQVLGSMGNKRPLEHLKRLVTDDPDEDVRRFAAASLVRISGKDALAYLLLAIQDNDPWVREDAALFLGDIGDPRAIPALECAMHDEEEDVREQARLAIDKLKAKTPKNKSD